MKTISTKNIGILFGFIKGIYIYKNIIKNNTRFVLQQHIQYSHSTFVLTAGLAFAWPAIKINKQGSSNDKKIPTIVDTADQLFENGRYEECYKLLKNSMEEQNVEIQWRLCRALYNMSKESKHDDKYKKNLIYEGFEIVSLLLNENQDHFAVHKWYALFLDAKSSYEGIKERIKQLENVKNHMDLAVTLNPSDATVLHMLGEWCYQITEMPWHQRKIAEVFFASLPSSTYEDALEYFLRAEAVEPRFFSTNLLRIGNCYLKLQKEDQAKYYLKLAASYPAKSNDDHKANKEASELLKKLNLR